MTTETEQMLNRLPPELKRRKVGAEFWAKECRDDEMAQVNLRQVNELIERFLSTAPPPPETMTKEEESMVAGAISLHGSITNPPPVIGKSMYGPGVPTGNN